MKLPDCKLNRRDLLLCAAVALSALLLAGALWAPSAAEGGYAVVTRDGTELARLPLDADESYTVVGDYENVITVHDGAVRIVRSTCPGEDCVHQGAVSRAGRAIVCLPNRVTVTVAGSDGVDTVIG